MKTYLSFDRKHLDEFIVFLIILMDCNFFYLFRVPSLLSNYWGFYVKGLLVVIAVAYSIMIKFWKTDYIFVKQYSILTTLSFCIVSVFSQLNYSHESFHYHFMLYGHIMVVFLAFPILACFGRDNGYEPFLKKLNIIAFIVYMVFIIQAVVSKIGGPFFLVMGFHQIRNGNLRMALSGIANMMIVYNFCRTFLGDERKNTFNIIQLILGLVCEFFIQQTRAYEIAFFITFGIVLIFKKYKTTRQKMVTVALCFLVAIAIYTGIIDRFISSFFEGSEVLSTEVRAAGYLYFWNAFLANPLWGHGYITGYDNYLIKTGPLGRFFYADIGYVGLMAQTGVFSFIIYVYPIIHWIKTLIVNRKQKVDVFLWALVIYIICLSPSLLVLNVERVMQWPICVALFAYFEKGQTGAKQDQESSLLWFGH